MTNAVVHEVLPCGVEAGVMHLPTRSVVAFQIRVLAGCCVDPSDRLGLARLVEETLDKGTEHFSGQTLSDAFDAIGAGRSSGTGRETTTLTCTVLPEHFERALELHGEMLRRPTFPESSVTAAVELAQQELQALEDDAQSLTDKIISAQTYGPILGRHPLGSAESLGRIAQADLVAHWKKYYASGRIVATVAGPIEPQRVLNALEATFPGFGDAAPAGRDPVAPTFHATETHQPKELEQQQISFCFPGVDAVHDGFPTQQVMLGVLSGGMSGRLFTEVREKRGLVYWVGAWQDTPRGIGTIFLGASTTPDRCDQTYETLLREVERVGEDLQQAELDRAITGIIASQETRGDATRARCSELANDLFFFRRWMPLEEKIARVRAVTIERIHRFLQDHPRDRLSVVTLGPRPLSHAPGDATAAGVSR